MLLQDHNYRMFDAHNLLTANGVEVYSVKADAMTIKTSDLNKAKEIIKFGDVIGEWRAEENKAIRLPGESRKVLFNKLINIPKLVNEKIHIKDEWDTPEICQQIFTQNPVIIRGKFPGTGKSHIGEYFQKMGKTVLFVVPTNRLLQEKEVEATTYNKFFSIAVHENVGEKLPQFDYSPFNVIVFDEIYMSSRYVLDKVRQFIINNPDLIVIGTGDVKQLQGIEVITNCQNPATFMDNCIDIILKYNIFLTICKRVGAKDSEEGERNRQLLNDIYDDFWEHELPMKEITAKHFETTDDIMASDHNIAYTNMRCRNVANEIRSRLSKKDEYEVGEILIARKWIDQPRVNPNIRYKITEHVKDTIGSQITLQNITNSKDTFMLYEPLVDANFIYPYCATCHSSQGASVKGTITIHEGDLPLASREWVWTAITRCVDFRNVRFFKNPTVDKQMDKNMIMRYFTNKVENYKLQDRKGNREINEEDYITPEWCLNGFRSRCEKCNTPFNFEVKNGKLCSNFTAQRVCNLRAHHVDNTVAFCVYCNCSAH